MKNKDSKFDWHSEQINLSTRITSSYKNTQNVRRFFKKHIGEDFHFTIKFMKYLKQSTGMSMKDAIDEWRSQNKNN